MMANSIRALVTHFLTREFYDGGKKTWNKAYWAKGKASGKKISIDKDKILTETQIARNAQALENMKAVYAATGGKTNRFQDKSPAEIGQQLYNAEDTCGNCGEMAAVAVYIAISIVNLDPNEVWYLTATNKIKKAEFGHSFVWLGGEPPKADPATVWIVDPWANVCCRLSEFQTELSDKLNNWTQQGKRIACQTTKLGKAYPIWAEPTNPLIAGVLQGKWIKFKAKEKMA